MKHISSRHNPDYKRLERLIAGKRAVGESERHVVLEGIHLCQAWLRHMGVPELALFDVDRFENDVELAELAGSLPPGTGLTCESGLVRALSKVEHGQGVYFLAERPVAVPPAIIDRNCLWLDRVQDPGNVGTLLRTAAAAGINQVYLSAGCASAWSQKVLRSAQGAHFVISIHEHVDLSATRKRLAIPLIATALRNAEGLYDNALPPQCAWLVGNEGQGVGDGLMAMADRRVFVPQATGVESLNVAVAAAICIFEQRRQHCASGRGRDARSFSTRGG